MSEAITSETLEREHKETAIALANKTILQQLDLITLMITQRNFKAAKLKLKQMKESVSELEQTLDNLTK